MNHMRRGGTSSRGAGGRRAGSRNGGKRTRGKIIELGTTLLVPREVVTVARHQNWLQHRMGRIHSRVDVCDNPSSCYVECLLRVLNAHNRCRGLTDVAF